MDKKNSVEEKQNYLRENIIEKGYDPNEFVEFAESKKGENAKDINHWRLPSLIVTVEEFKKMNLPKKINYGNGNNIDTYEKLDFEEDEEEEKLDNNEFSNNEKDKVNSINEESEVKIEKKKTNENNIIPLFNDKDNQNETNKKIFINCEKTELTKISEIKNCYVKIIIINIKEGGFFTSTQLKFEIETIPLNIKVKRTNFDFELLHSILTKIYNNTIINNLPKNEIEEKTILKTCKNYERFLNYLLNDDLIRNSKILYDFLTLDEKQFPLTFNYYKIIPNKEQLSEFKSLTGKIYIDYNEENIKYYNKLKENINVKYDLLYQLNNAFYYYDKLNEQIKNQINEIISLFDKLKKNSQENSEDNTIISLFDFFSQIYKDLKITTEKLNFINNFDLKNYSDFFLNCQLNSIKNFFKEKIDNSFNLYKHHINNIKELKNNGYNEKNSFLWDLSGLNQNNVLNEKEINENIENEKKKSEYYKNLYGNYLNQIEEINENLKINIKKELISCYENFCQKNLECLGVFQRNINCNLNILKAFGDYILIKENQ